MGRRQRASTLASCALSRLAQPVPSRATSARATRQARLPLSCSPPTGLLSAVPMAATACTVWRRMEAGTRRRRTTATSSNIPTRIPLSHTRLTTMRFERVAGWQPAIGTPSRSAIRLLRLALSGRRWPSRHLALLHRRCAHPLLPQRLHHRQAAVWRTRLRLSPHRDFEAPAPLAAADAGPSCAARPLPAAADPGRLR